MRTVAVKEVSVMTTTLIASPSKSRVAHRDLTDRQFLLLAVIAAVVLLAGLVGIAVAGGPALVPATTGVEDLTAGAVAVLF
jgi:hypothetical protein